MNQKGELIKDDLVVDREMQIDCDTAQEILVYFETWFDVDRKFGVDTSADDTWLNMYGRYNPYEDTLSIECTVSSDDSWTSFDYVPTEAEEKIMKEMITAKIQEEYHQSPQEFCESILDEGLEIGGIQ